MRELRLVDIAALINSRRPLTMAQRTRHQVNYPETYKLIFARLRQELSDAASSGRPIQHLILLLGIPIAYPVCADITVVSHI